MLVELNDVIRWLKENINTYQDPANDYLLDGEYMDELTTDMSSYFSGEK